MHIQHIEIPTILSYAWYLLLINIFVVQSEQPDQKRIVFKVHHVGRDTEMFGQIIQYTKFKVNIGGGYNTSTGIFTVPVAGLYLFTVQMCIHNNKYVKFVIRANDATIGQLQFKSNENGDVCVSDDGLAVLSVGDQVYVRCYSTGGDYGKVLPTGDDYNTFTGILLQPGV